MYIGFLHCSLVWSHPTLTMDCGIKVAGRLDSPRVNLSNMRHTPRPNCRSTEAFSSVSRNETVPTKNEPCSRCPWMKSAGDATTKDQTSRLTRMNEEVPPPDCMSTLNEVFHSILDSLRISATMVWSKHLVKNICIQTSGTDIE